ncbi:MAG TPA: ABC transporter ATP-binding protein [Pseudonocardia sp.]|jgi:ATP-binding cassette subfamily B protein|nr:ABC transporter ATP-binding protein [Pseudonocardia sp.]
MLVRLLRTHLRPYRRPLQVVIVLQLLGTIAMVYLPRLNADIIDLGIARGDTDYIVSTGGWMLLVTLVQILCSVGAVYYGARTAMGVGRDLRAAVFGRVSEFSAREVNRFGAPSLITRTTNDVQQVQMLVMMGATMLVTAPIMCVGGVVMALREDIGLAWLVAVCVPVLLVSIGLVVRRMVPQFRLMQTRIDAVNRVLREQITGIRVVRAFVREPVEAQRFDAANREVTDVAVAAGRLFALVFPIVMLIVNVSTVAVLWFGALRIDAGLTQIGSLTAFIAYLVQILMAVMMATLMATLIPRAAVCADRITEVLDTESSVAPPQHPVRPARREGLLTFTGVGFHYPGADAPVLRGIDLTATPGTTTAIVGSTGAGKTTLLSMVPRLFDATEGTVAVDGVDVRDFELEELWSRIGLVPQRPFLFSGTVAENLRQGRPEATDDELWEALEVAQAGFVRDLSDGLDSVITQGGSNVSGGQRQRLAIARALVKRPEIYLFDDSFSALDLATDARLRAALRPRTAAATVVVVAQRVSSIIEADRIVVLDGGVVVGSGTHRQLLADCPTYVEIVESQLGVEAAA